MSIQVWGIACAAVVKLVGEAGVAVWKVVVEARGEKSAGGVKVEMETRGEGKERGQAMGVGVGAGGGMGKKEL